MAVDPRVAAFQQSQAPLAAAKNARTVPDWIRVLEQYAPNSPKLQALRANPNGYEVKAGSLRKKTALDVVGNHPWLTVGAFLAGAAAPALIGGGGSAAAATGSSGATSLSGLYAAPGAVASQGVSAGTGAGMGAKGFFSTLGKFFGSPGGSQMTDLAGNLIGAGMQNRSANRAADISGRYNQDALAFLKEQDARDYAEYQKERERGWRYEDEDRRYASEDRAHRYKREGEREGRLAPFRQGAERGYQTLSSLLFNPNQQTAMHAPVGDVQRRSLADLVVR